MPYKFNWTRIQKAGFFTHHWNKKPCLLKGVLPADFDGITPEELAGLALEESIESRIVLQHGEQDYELRRGPFTEEDFAHLPEQNWTLLVQGVDRLVPEVQKLLTAFDFIPYWRLDDIMISYAVTGGNVGPHFDHYHVFLYQASGKRRWTLTSQQCVEDNYLENVPLRLMREFPVELEYEVEPGDVLYIPPLWGHHGVALDDACMTASIGYRSLRAKEIIEALADWLNEQPAGARLFEDPSYLNLPAGLLADPVAKQALDAVRPALQPPGLHQALAQMVTLPDQAAIELLPQPLEPPYSLEELPDLLHTYSIWLRDSVTRMAYTPEGKLYVNGSECPVPMSEKLVHMLADHIVYEDLKAVLTHPQDSEALLYCINQQWVVPDED